MNAPRISFWELILGCHHRHLSWPMTLDHRTYRVCCDCGAQFDYSCDGVPIPEDTQACTGTPSGRVAMRKL